MRIFLKTGKRHYAIKLRKPSLPINYWKIQLLCDRHLLLPTNSKLLKGIGS